MCQRHQLCFSDDNDMLLIEFCFTKTLLEKNKDLEQNFFKYI